METSVLNRLAAALSVFTSFGDNTLNGEKGKEKGKNNVFCFVL